MEQKLSLLEKAEKSWFSYFIKNRRVAFLAALILAVWGGSAALSIPKESAPKIEYGIISITTFYNGASAVDMDKLVTQEIENKIKDVTAIDKITSTSSNSFSSVTVQLETDADIGKAVADLRSKVDEAKSKLPADAEDPNLLEIDSSMDPIFNVNLSGNLHPALLRDYAEQLKKYLEQDSVIREITISGGAEREIYVDVDPLKLAQYKLNLAEITSAIQNTHRDFPIGDFQIENLNYALRFEGQHKNATEIGAITLKMLETTQGQTPLQIKDVASVYENSEEIETLQSFTDLKTGSGARLPTVLLSINKSGDSNIFKVDPAIRTKVLDYVAQNFGEKVKVYFTSEQVEYTRESYDTVIANGISSFLVVFFILLLFIGPKEALVASLIIPLTFLVTIGVTKARGETLNFMVNFSLILSLGILVDTAIVIVEGVYEGIRNGKTPQESAMLAVAEFKAPLISSTLTTLSVFIPLLFLPGILGKYLSFIPISVSITMIGSLIIALLILPALAGTFLKDHSRVDQQKLNFFGILLKRFYQTKERYIEKLQKKYENFIIRKLRSPRWRFYAIYSVIIVCVLTFFLPVKFVLFPSDDSDYMYVSVTLPEGTVKEETLAKTLPVEKILTGIPETKRFETKVSGNTARINLELLKKAERKEAGLKTSRDLAETLRAEFKHFQNYEVTIEEVSGGPPSDAPVAFRIIAQDTETLAEAQKVATELKAILKSLPGTDNVKDDLTNIPGEITYRVKREEALNLGLVPETVAMTVRTALKGSDAITLTREGREIDVQVRYTENEIRDFEDLGNLQLVNNQGRLISLSQVVTPELTSALSEIRRTDRRIAVTISSQLTPTGNALEITTLFQEKIADYVFPKGVSLEDAGENAENAELFVSLGTGAILAVFLMFLILVIQFNSFSYPLIILFTIVMSFIGVNTGLFITGTPRSLAMIIGTISLAGIVVNDAIVLIDRINNLRAENARPSLEEIIAYAGSSRLQPIVLTTLTTVAGIAPLVVVDTFWAGLAYTIVFGLSVATILTLFVTPCMYYQFTLYMYQIVYRMLIALSLIVAIVCLINGQIPATIIFVLITLFLFFRFKKVHRRKQFEAQEKNR